MSDQTSALTKVEHGKELFESERGDAVATGGQTPPNGTDSSGRNRGSALARNRRRRTVGRRSFILFLQIAIPVLIVVLWQFFSGKPGEPHVLIDQYYISKPSLIWDAMKSWYDRGILWSNLWVTLQETIYGFVLGAIVGLFFGFVFGVNQFLAAVFQPIVDALYAIPRLALVPLFMLWFGIGIGSKLALIISVVGFLVFYATYAGVKDVDHHLVDKLRLMRASRLKVHMKATLPSAMTFIISGLSVSAPYALVVAVTAEMLSSNRGMGYLLIQSSNQFDTAGTFAAIVLLMIVGLLLMFVIRMLERWLLRWKPKRPSGSR